MSTHCRPTSMSRRLPARAEGIRCEVCDLPPWQQILYAVYFFIKYGLFGKEPPTE